MNSEKRSRLSARWHDDPVKIAPYVPTPYETVKAMLELAEASENDTLIDLGCGDGRILYMAVTVFKAKQAIGYEIDQELCRKVNEQAFRHGLDQRVKAICRDLFEADLSEASIITLYLTGTGNERLKAKLEKETHAGTRIVSHDFSIGDWIAESVHTTNSEALNPHRIFLYRNPQSFPRKEKSRLLNSILPGIQQRLGRHLPGSPE